MKTLYVLTSNNGDGSSSVCATFDANLIAKMDEAYGDGTLDFETWSDGDGFHYSTWTLPDECTPQSMGFSELTDEDVFG